MISVLMLNVRFLRETTKGHIQTDKAVEETKGLCLFYGDEVIGAYYASNCGGISENVENVWPDRSGPVPYWSSHFDSDNGT